MHPASTASLRVASSSFAVMKMTGHFDPDAASRRCNSIPEIPPRWMSSSRQVAVCALPLSSNASAEANARLSMPLFTRNRVVALPCGPRPSGRDDHGDDDEAGDEQPDAGADPEGVEHSQQHHHEQRGAPDP